ncbi:hypothetical protein AQUCO_01100363v1 [Aquilegia coerulea]|uniref:Uncharacterized protein n=1 Tax=Aquilegia coerulea TaxID=218851 RepID=A0A2G5E6U2_AQUCA|nr:hypothetical protein AQUCO_01100363v1 [Aquilegia coerulea]
MNFYSFFHHHIKTQPHPWIFLLSSLGLLLLLKSSISFLKWVYITFLRHPKDLKKCYGSWVLITGATDGIGKAFAYELAKKGLNLILVGRNSNKLKIVSREIHTICPNVKIKTIVLDFSNDLTAGICVIEEAIQAVDVGVLINNVGVSYSKATYFHEVDEEVWMNLVRVNVEGTTQVTKVVVPGMLKRKKGVIVNVGSGASIVVPSHPLFAIYAATKAYVDQLSRCMYVEYKGYGIDVQCQVPLYVATNMASKVAFIKKSSLFVPTPEAYAQAAIRRIGYEPRCTPYWTHSLQWYLASLLPENVLDAWRLSIGIGRMKLGTQE